MIVVACKPGCGECCGVIPFEKELYDIAVEEGLLQVKPAKVTECRMSDKDPTIFVFAETEDYHCPFLIRQTKLCSIYSRRPRICRIYGEVTLVLCPYFDTSGRARSESEVRRVKRVVDKQMDGRYKDVCRRMNIDVRTP